MGGDGEEGKGGEVGEEGERRGGERREGMRRKGRGGGPSGDVADQAFCLKSASESGQLFHILSMASF